MELLEIKDDMDGAVVKLSRKELAAISVALDTAVAQRGKRSVGNNNNEIMGFVEIEAVRDEWNRTVVGPGVFQYAMAQPEKK